MPDQFILPTAEDRSKGHIFQAGVVMMNCENRRKFYQLGSFSYQQRGFYGKVPFDPEDSRYVYLILHEQCIHRAPIIQRNDKHPGVPMIFTSIYYPQFNGVYRNAVGEILGQWGTAHLAGLRLVKDVLVSRCSDLNHLPLGELHVFSKLAHRWVTPRLGITPQSKSL